MTSPAVSVVLSARNGADALPGAIESILQQSFGDFELIAINNGSVDRTGKVLEGIRDPRMRVFHQDGVELARALNRGISLARGKYIARQDHDDVARPTRLEKQVAFLEANSNCALVGTHAEIWVGDERTERTHEHPTEDAALKFELLFDNPFVHSSVMLRKAAVEAIGGYSTDPARQPPEDYELWSRLARYWRVANLPERLTIYRETPGSMSRTGQNPFQQRLVLISSENLAAAGGEAIPKSLHRDIAALTHGAFAMVSRTPDIDDMCRAVEQVGARIHASAPGSDVPVRVAGRIKTLRRQYAENRYRKTFGRAWPLARLGWRYSGLGRLKRRLRTSRP
jgi:hypothetical protein